MKIFEHPNLRNNWICPICKTNADEPITLVNIYGTLENGVIEAEQIHVSCIDLNIVKLPYNRILIQQYEDE